MPVKTRNFHSQPDHHRFLPARKNPLCIDKVTNLPFRFPTGNWKSEMLRLEHMGYRASIVGLQGSGKSTLLSELNLRLQRKGVAAHFLFIPNLGTWSRGLHREKRFNPSAEVADAIHASLQGKVVLVDGIERINFFLKRRLLKKTIGHSLVVVQHKKSKLPTWIHCETNQALMKQLLEELGLNQTEILAAAHDAFEKNGGNIRMALRELYDQFAAGQFVASQLKN